jgi:hypothetical protein
MGALTFLTPLAALAALAGLVPLAAFLRREQRARRVRETLGLAEPPPRGRRMLVAALVAVSVLTGAAAAQPVIDRSKARGERADAEMLVVVDTSRSMLAAAGPDDPTRIDRARTTAIRLREELAEVPAGLATLTDRTLPHLFPTIDDQSFATTLFKSIGIERPGPTIHSTLATDLTALASVGREGYFSPRARKRLLVVLTDGETLPVKPGLGNLANARVSTVFVHVWGSDEAIYLTTKAEPEYRPDPSSRGVLANAAALVDGAVFDEDEFDAVVARARENLGRGPIRPRTQRDLLALMPYVMLAALLPLGFVLLRRNV